MHSIRILIVDDNEAFSAGLHDALASQFVIRTCQSGKEALEAVSSFHPDILVIDLLLRELDGLTLLFQISGMPDPPAVLVTTPFVSDYVKDQLSSLRIGNLLLKPCELKAVIQRICLIATACDRPISPMEEMITTQILCEFGIPAHMDGYVQLKTAIPLFTRDPSKPLNKVICAEVADKCGFSNSKQVERSIRNAISKAWELRNAEKWNQHFPSGKPTNKQFISCLSQEMNHRLLQLTEPAAH